MTELLVHSAAAIPAYEGPNEIPGIRFRGARAALGVTAWGMNVLDLAAGCTGYPEHDHGHDGQEEVYVLLEGAALLIVGEQRLPMRAGDLVRVPPERTRKFVTEGSSARILALGGVPGKAFTPTM